MLFGRRLDLLGNIWTTFIWFEKKVFRRFRNAGLKLGPKKCSFAAQSCNFLGHLISKDGIRPPPDRVKAITEYPRPKNVKELRRLLGLFNWFRKFIPNYNALVNPLTRLLKKGQLFKWRSEQETAFNDLKQKLRFPKYYLTFLLSVDTSSREIGYMLFQLDPNDNTQNLATYNRVWLQIIEPMAAIIWVDIARIVRSGCENILDCANYLRGNSFGGECHH